MADRNPVRFLAVSVPKPKDGPTDDNSKIELIRAVFAAEWRPDVYHFKIPNFTVSQLGRLFEQTADLDRLVKRAYGLVERTGTANLSLYDDDQTETGRVQLEQGKTFDKAVVNFAWDSVAFPARAKSLDEIASLIGEEITETSQSTNKAFNSYRQARAELQAFDRTMRSSLATRPLEFVIQPHHSLFHQTADALFLEPVLVVAPTDKRKALMALLATDPVASPLVAPDTVDVIAADGDSTMFVVIVFRPERDRFAAVCVQNGFVVRAYSVDEERSRQAKAAKAALARRVQDKWGDCLRLGAAAFGQAVKLWCHAVGTLVFVESALRYGLEDNTTAFFIRIDERTGERVTAALQTAFQALGDPSVLRKSAADVGDLAEKLSAMALPGHLVDPDYTPYVSVKMDGPATMVPERSG